MSSVTQLLGSAVDPVVAPDAPAVFLAIAAVLAVTFVAGAAFARIGQPRVVGEIVAGLVLGPSVAGALAPSVTEHVFPGPVASVLVLLGHVGLVLFMFFTGWEFDRALAARTGPRIAALSAVSCVLPFALGLVLAAAIFGSVGAGSFGTFAVFVGIAVSITAFPVLARILAATKLEHTVVGTIAISCAAVDDIIAWTALAGLTAVTRSTGSADVLVTLVGVVCFVAGWLWLGPRVMRWLCTTGPAQPRRAIAPITVVAVLVTASTAEWTALSAVFGAFLVGLAMPRATSIRRELAAVESASSLLLLPLFFFTVGLEVRVGLLDRPGLWALLAAVVGVAILGKFGGAFSATRLIGLNVRDSASLGVLLNTRGLTEIVVVSVGRDLGLVSPVLFTVMVLMAVITTVMTGPLLALIRRERVNPAPVPVAGHDIEVAHALP